ncbi:hypothetical protein Ddye_030262 [Dipteronia dyeriana]|uniref:Reverse transcriptase domain-containing protein n=1 Tax=Dipteronia dyeriana TaxID=168575 RepID=A0AAD9THA8_9ROSI|nr:hypothetical protein Ddye_030262 [Dipteronia dyeriana]
MVWTVRGMGTSNMKDHNVSVLAVSEPFQDVDQIRRWELCLHFPNISSNVEERGKVWVFWKDNIQLDIVGSSNQCLTVLLSEDSGLLLTTFIYAKCSQIDRRELYEKIYGISTFCVAWVMLSDFNTILYDTERVGAVPRISSSMVEFNDCIYRYVLLNLIFEVLIPKMSEKHILPFSHPGGAPAISHLLCADDVVIFDNSSKMSVRGMMKVFKKYESCTGKRVNHEKSVIFFSKHLSLRRNNEILNETSFVEGKFPFTYLGVSIVDGKLKVSQFDPLIKKISKKTEDWKIHLLSQGGRLVLLRHVLSSMHLLSVLNTLKTVFKKIKDSLSWRKIIRRLPVLLNNSKWKVREGNVNLWMLKSCKGFWVLEKVEEVMERVGKLRNSEDVLLWLPKKNGFFNTKSTWLVMAT